jgi:hypothetical protein
LSRESTRLYSSSSYRTLSSDPLLKAYIHVNRSYQLRQLFPRIVWASTLLSIYSLLEHTLDDFCDIVQQEESLLLSARDLKDRGIKRSETYLRKVARIPFPSELKEWQHIQDANTIRNCLSHAGGILEDSNDKKRLRKIVAKDRHLKIVDGQLVVSQKYVLRLLSSARILITKLTDSPISMADSKMLRAPL